MALRLYSTTYCPYAWATRIMLREKGVSFEVTEVDLRNKPDDLLQISPKGQVPMLVDGDLCLGESMVIAEYIEEKYPLPNMLGEHAADRARVRSALVDCLWVRSRPLAKLAAMLYYLQEETHRRRIEQEMARWHQYLDELDARLAQHEWLVLDRMTLADIHLFPMVAVGRALGATIGPDRRFLAAWYEQMASLPSVRQASPELTQARA